MSVIGTGNLKINELANLGETKPAQAPAAETGKPVLSSLQLGEKTDLSANTARGIAATSLDLDLSAPAAAPEALPEIKTQTAGSLTYQTNAYGNKITTLHSEGGTSYNVLSQDGLAIILKNNVGKRDVLVFSAMTDKVEKNSNIHDNYFHTNVDCDKNVTFKLAGKCDAKMFFDKQHNIVLEFNDKEKLVIDGKDGQTVLQGPFKVDFNPNSDGNDFKVNYTGSEKIPRFTSKGGKIKF